MTHTSQTQGKQKKGRGAAPPPSSPIQYSLQSKGQARPEGWPAKRGGGVKPSVIKQQYIYCTQIQCYPKTTLKKSIFHSIQFLFDNHSLYCYY
jgi:hypothetical protein